MYVAHPIAHVIIIVSHLAQSEIHGPVRFSPAVFLVSPPTILPLAHLDPDTHSLLVPTHTESCPDHLVGPEPSFPVSVMARSLFFITSAQRFPSQ